MVTSVRQMLETANAAVPKITPDQASDMIKKGNTLVVDVRDAPEVSASGKIAGAVNVSRGMLEFRADPDSPYHDKNFDKEKTVILYCASGGRSALAGKVLKDMGYDKVYNVGGFMDWADYLRDQAAMYRKLAEQTDDPVVKNEMLELASVCVEVANNIEDHLTG